MKTLFSIFLIGLFAFNCSSQNIKVRVYNKTGYQLDSLYLGDIYVGKLDNDSSYVISNLQIVKLLNGFPVMLAPWGNIRMNNWAKNGYHWIKGGVYSPVCNTGAIEVATGNYEFDITILERPEGVKLAWDVHARVK